MGPAPAREPPPNSLPLMSRTAIIVVQVIAAVLALGLIYFSLVIQVMRPSSTAADVARVLAVGTVVVLTVVGLTAKGGTSARNALLLTLAAGVAPIAVYQIDQFVDDQRGAAWQRGENARHDAKARERIENRTRDVEARLARKRAYAGQDALDFVDEVSYVDLGYLGLPDRSGVMLDLLKRALAAKLIDPNIMVKGPRPVDVKPEPLFLHYYRANIRRFPNNSVVPRSFEIFQLLVAGGADLALAPSHPIAEDLARGLKTDQWGNYKLD